MTCTLVSALASAWCEVTETDGPAVVRRKVLLTLTELCSRLPDDLRLAALVALALHQEATNQTLDRRVAWLADHFDHNPKTARRRIDDAFRLIAEQLDGPASSGQCVTRLDLGRGLVRLFANRAGRTSAPDQARCELRREPCREIQKVDAKVHRAGITMSTMLNTAR